MQFNQDWTRIGDLSDPAEVFLVELDGLQPWKKKDIYGVPNVLYHVKPFSQYLHLFLPSYSSDILLFQRCHSTFLHHSDAWGGNRQEVDVSSLLALKIKMIGSPWCYRQLEILSKALISLPHVHYKSKRLWVCTMARSYILIFQDLWSPWKIRVRHTIISISTFTNELLGFQTWNLIVVAWNTRALYWQRHSMQWAIFTVQHTWQEALCLHLLGKCQDLEKKSFPGKMDNHFLALISPTLELSPWLGKRENCVREIVFHRVRTRLDVFN